MFVFKVTPGNSRPKPIYSLDPPSIASTPLVQTSPPFFCLNQQGVVRVCFPQISKITNAWEQQMPRTSRRRGSLPANRWLQIPGRTQSVGNRSRSVLVSIRGNYVRVGDL